MNSDPGGAFVFWLLLGLIVFGAVASRVKKHLAEAKLREEDPSAWVRLKEIENDKLRRRHEKKIMRTKIGWSVASWLFKNYWQ